MINAATGNNDVAPYNVENRDLVHNTRNVYDTTVTIAQESSFGQWLVTRIGLVGQSAAGWLQRRFRLNLVNVPASNFP